MNKITLLFSSIRKRGLIKTLRYIWSEIVFDVIHGTDTSVCDKVDPTVDVFNFHQGASPEIVKQCFSYLKKDGVKIEESIFLDIGCGKGRVMVLALLAGFKYVYGVEMCEKYCSIANDNLLKLSTNTRCKYKIFVGDVREVGLKKADVVFIYNPFGAKVMDKLLKYNNNFYLIYVNPVCYELLEDKLHVQYKSIEGEAFIYKIGKWENSL